MKTPSEPAAETALSDRLSVLAERLRAHPLSGATKVWLMMILTSAALMVLGYEVGGRYGLLLLFVLSLTVCVIVTVYSDARLRELFPSRELEGRDPWGLIRDAGHLAARLGTHRPQLIAFSSTTPMIYSFGILKGQSTIAFSESALERLAPEERRAILTLELCRQELHITPTSTAASALGYCVEVVGRALDLSIFAPLYFTTRARRYLGRPDPIQLGLSLAAPIIALVHRITVGEAKILAADARAARSMELFGLTESAGRQVLARALYKLEGYAAVAAHPVRHCDAAAFTVNPLSAFRVHPYFLVQPPLATRLTALIGRPVL